MLVFVLLLFVNYTTQSGRPQLVHFLPPFPSPNFGGLFFSKSINWPSLGPSPDLGSRLLSGKRPTATPVLPASAQTPAGVWGRVSPHLPLDSLAGSPGFRVGRARRLQPLSRPPRRASARPSREGAWAGGGSACEEASGAPLKPERRRGAGSGRPG